MKVARTCNRDPSMNAHDCVSYTKIVEIFQQSMLAWYRINKRTYSWRLHNEPYRILIAEVMLQHTNADRVEPIFRKFMANYPTIDTLAQSDLQGLSCMLKPLGLGYRAARLKAIGVTLVSKHGGAVPCAEECLMSLPGIGRYMANAILCFAYSNRVALVDVNVIRLYERVFGFKSHKDRVREDSNTWRFATELLPVTDYKEYNLALLDFAAQICRARKQFCSSCSVREICLHLARSLGGNGN